MLPAINKVLCPVTSVVFELTVMDLPSVNDLVNFLNKLMLKLVARLLCRQFRGLGMRFHGNILHVI